MRPVTINPTNVAAALTEIQRASHEADTTEIAQNFSIDDAGFTETFEINTASPTAANCALVLATLLEVLKRGGLNRTQ